MSRDARAVAHVRPLESTVSHPICPPFARRAASLATSFALVFLAASTLPARANGLALDQAVARALEVAPELVRARALQSAAAERAVGAAQLRDPELLLGLDNVPIDGDDAGSLSADFMTMRRIGLMQRFEGAGQRRAGQVAADAGVALREAAGHTQRAVVARAAAQAWFDWALAAARLALLDGQRHRYELQVAAADARIAAGGGAMDGLSARRELAEYEARLDAAQGDRLAAAAMLARWLDEPVVGDPDALPAIDGLPAAIEDAAGATLPEIVEGERRVDQARALAERARLERRPDWSLEASYAERGSQYSDMVTLGVRIDLPLRAAQRQDREYAARMAERDAAEAQLEQRRRERGGEIEALRARWLSAGMRVARYRATIEPLAQAEADAALAAYRGGAADLTDTLDATHSAERTSLDALDAVADQAGAWAALRYLQPES
jgi:outer membrane protein TolC